MATEPWIGSFEGERVARATSRIDARINWLRGLDRPENAGRPDVASALGSFSWLQVHSVGYRASKEWSARTLSPWSGLSRLDMKVAFLMAGCNGEAQLYWGLAGSKATPLRSLLEAIWPGSQIASLPAPPQLPDLPSGKVGGGLPSLPAPQTDQTAVNYPTAIDIALRGVRLCSGSWAWLVVGEPVRIAQLHEWHADVMHEITTVRQSFLQPNTAESLGRAPKALETLLESHLALLEQALGEGGWLTYGLALTTPGDLQTLSAALGTAFGSHQVEPEPWRLRPAGPVSNSMIWGGQLTLLPASRIAVIADMPREEHPGVAVSQVTAFDLVPTDQKGHDTAQHLELGPIVDGGRDLSSRVSLPLDELSSHLFIAGITGAGKTTTVRTLLQQAAVQGVRTLIIEPVKREYRSLNLPGLRVHALGEPGCRLQLNPFLFETGPAGVQCTTHADLLKALFAAAYVLYAPMPYILEQALLEVYQDRGWDFASGLCWRAPGGHERAWPTLTELRHKVGEIVGRSGYGPRLEPEIRAALEIRIDNLRVGAKGQLLDVRRSVTLAELTEQPTILELQGIGDPEQRAFLLGLILTKLYEGCLAWGPSNHLKLLVVLEEAHRLLEERVGGSEDFANPQAKAVQTFADMLAELRAYGVGLIVAEQSPSRITRQVLKNTATKIAHQLVDEEEWRLMGGSMALTEDKSRALAILPRGHALVFAPNMDHPIHVHVEPRGQSAGPSPMTTPAAPQPNSMPIALQTLSLDERVRDAFIRLVYAAVLEATDDVASTWQAFRKITQAQSPLALRTVSGSDAVIDTVVADLCEWVVSSWGRWYGWPFEVEAEVLGLLRSLTESNASSLSATQKELVGTLCTQLTALPPFAGCAGCPSPCQYRAFVRLARADRVTKIEASFVAVETDPLVPYRTWVEQTAETIAPHDAATWPDLVRCLASHQAHVQGWAESLQVRFSQSLMGEEEALA